MVGVQSQLLQQACSGAVCPHAGLGGGRQCLQQLDYLRQAQSLCEGNSKEIGNELRSWQQCCVSNLLINLFFLFLNWISILSIWILCQANRTLAQGPQKKKLISFTLTDKSEEG